MLQRIQTVYMLLAIITLAYSAYLGINVMDNVFAMGYGVSALLVFINLFLYKKRAVQIKLNYLVILLILLLSGLSLYQSGIVSGEKSFSKKDIEWLIPLVSIVFLLTANKYIKRDEALVKSVDRIR